MKTHHGSSGGHHPHCASCGGQKPRIRRREFRYTGIRTFKFLRGPGTSDSNENQEDEEEDGHGELVLNPRFGLQRPMTLERGLEHPFLHSQVLPIDTRGGVRAVKS
jgi:hypothetical protein